MEVGRSVLVSLGLLSPVQKKHVNRSRSEGTLSYAKDVNERYLI